jgi:hypothetical protein
MSLNAMAREWAPPSAPAPTVPTFPGSVAFTLHGHEPGPAEGGLAEVFKCARKVPSPVRTLAEAVQLMSAYGASSRSAGVAKPCWTQGFLLAPAQLEADVASAALARCPGLLLPLAASGGVREWTGIVELFAAVNGSTAGWLDGVDKANIAICFVVHRRCEYLGVVAKDASDGFLDRLEAQVRSTFKVARVTRVAGFFDSVVSTVARPRACALQLVECGSDERAAAAEFPDGLGGSLAADDVRLVALPPLAPPSLEATQRILAAIKQAYASNQANGDRLLTLVTLPCERASGQLCDAFRLLLGLLQEHGLVPTVCIDHREPQGQAHDLCDDGSVVRLLPGEDAKSARANTADRLWPRAPTSPTPAVIPRVFQTTLVPMASLCAAARVLDFIRSHLDGSATALPAQRPVSRSNFSDMAGRIAAADDVCVARRNVIGRRVLLAVVPALPPTEECREPLPARMYCIDPDLTVAYALPAEARSSPRRLPTSGLTLLEAVQTASHFLGQTKIVIVDVLVWDGRKRDRAMSARACLSQCAPFFETDSCYSFPSPIGLAVVRAEHFALPDAYKGLLSATAAAVDYQVEGIVLQGACDQPLALWQHPDACTVTFTIHAADRLPGESDVWRLQLSAVDDHGAPAPYGDEYCDAHAEALSREPAAGDVLQALLRHDADGAHWWEPLRLIAQAEWRDMTDSGVAGRPFGRLQRELTSRDVVEQMTCDPFIAPGDLEFLLRCRSCVCATCGTVTDDGITATDTFRCTACWHLEGRGSCDGCGAAFTTGRVHGDHHFFCDVCWGALLKRQPREAVRGMLLLETELRGVLLDGFAAQDEHLRLAAASPTAGSPVASSPALPQPKSGSAAPPPYVAAAASTPATLSLQWPPSVTACMALARAAVLMQLRLDPHSRSVVELCCGHDAAIDLWLRAPYTHSYVGTDLSAAAVQLADSRAAALRRGGRSAGSYAVVCADNFQPNFWQRRLLRCLPRGSRSVNLVTCFRSMPLQRALQDKGATTLFAQLKDVVAPNGIVILALVDVHALATNSAPYDFKWRDAAHTMGQVTFKRLGVSAAKAIEIPAVDLTLLDGAAKEAGFATDTPAALGLPQSVYDAAEQVLAHLGGIMEVAAANQAASTAADNSWTVFASGGGAHGFMLTTEAAALLRAVKFHAFRRVLI